MKSFFEKLTGTVDIDDLNESISEKEQDEKNLEISHNEEDELTEEEGDWMEEETQEGELTVDMYQDEENIYIRTMVAGVKPDDLDVDISRDMVTIKGKREESKMVDEEDYFARELYWGSFSRTITLPEEISIDDAEAEEKHGLLTITLPKADKGRKTKLKIKSK